VILFLYSTEQGIMNVVVFPTSLFSVRCSLFDIVCLSLRLNLNQMMNNVLLRSENCPANIDLKSTVLYAFF